MTKKCGLIPAFIHATVIQNSMPKFGQSYIISEKPGRLSEKVKFLTSLKCHKVQYFLLKFCTRILLNNVYERMLGIFFILFRSRVIDKNVKNLCVETRSFLVFANNSRSKQNKKITNTHL